MLEEEKVQLAKLSNKAPKKSDEKCEKLVTQMEDLTNAKTKSVAEITRMTTLADSFQTELNKAVNLFDYNQNFFWRCWSPASRWHSGARPG